MPNKVECSCNSLFIFYYNHYFSFCLLKPTPMKISLIFSYAVLLDHKNEKLHIKRSAIETGDDTHIRNGRNGILRYLFVSISLIFTEQTDDVTVLQYKCLHYRP